MKDDKEIWTKRNNAGEGFDVGKKDDSINEIEGLGELVTHSQDNDGYAVYRNADGGEVIVADANGPWAVNA